MNISIRILGTEANVSLGGSLDRRGLRCRVLLRL